MDAGEGVGDAALGICGENTWEQLTMVGGWHDRCEALLARLTASLTTEA